MMPSQNCLLTITEHYDTMIVEVKEMSKKIICNPTWNYIVRARKFGRDAFKEIVSTFSKREDAIAYYTELRDKADWDEIEWNSRENERLNHEA
jgi:hypothetical protein